MHSCTDAYTHSNQDVGQKRDYWYIYGTTLGCTSLQETIKEGLVDMGIYLDIHACTDVFNHWNQGMARKEG